MKIRSLIGACCAAFTLAAGGAFAGPTVLYIAGSNDASYQTHFQTKFPVPEGGAPEDGGVWVYKGVGTGADQIGGDLDVTANFTGVNGGTGITRRAYLESFDLIIIGVPTTSTQFQQPADWAALSKPVLVHSGVVARSTRFGLISTDTVPAPALSTVADTADSVRVSTSALSDTLLADVVAVTDLYLAASTDSALATTTFGTGEEITRVVSSAVPAVEHRGLIYWPAGTTGSVTANTLVGKRAFLPLKIGNLSLDLNANGLKVLDNVIDQLLLPPEVVIFPAPSLSATSGLSQINLSWSAVATATGYNLKRSLAAGGPYTTIGANLSGLTYTDTAVVNGTPYYYVVSSVKTGAESADSAEASATSVAVIQPAKNILYVAGSNSAGYQTFATSGQFANHTWTFKAGGVTGDDTVGGDLSRLANFTGPVNSATGISVQAYLNSFDLVIIGVPTTSTNFADTLAGAGWAGVTTPIIFHANTTARAVGGRPGLFLGDNFITVDLTAAAETVRTSTSSLANDLFAGVADATNLYSLSQADTINLVAAFGNGESITHLTNGTVTHHGITFWPAGAVTATNLALADNRAFLPLKGGFTDLTADGQKVLANLLNEVLETQAAAPLLAPTNLVATENTGAVNLAWGFGYGSTTYTVRRSTTSGSGYTVLSAGAIPTGTTTYTDSTAVAGATYFYVVTSVKDAATADSAEATVTLAAPVGGLTTWRQAKFSTTENTGDAADSADPDFDGRSNLIEYATGTEPLVADAGPAAVLGQAAGKLTLTFNRIADPALTYAVRGSFDLTATWNETPVLTSTGAGNIAGSVTAEDSVAVSAQPRRFLRLEVTY